MTSASWVVALVARVVARGGDRSARQRRDVLACALTTTRQRLLPYSTAQAFHGEYAMLLAARAGPGPPGGFADECAGRLAEALSAVIRAEARAQRVVVGVGQPRSGLGEGRCSGEEAVLACRAGEFIPELGPVVHWARLGIYGSLLRMSADQLAAARVHPALEQLFDDHAKLPLLETLEAYLDRAGTAHVTAAAMHIHRATLYYRLQRVAELASANLKDGNERLCLHLAFKIGRLTGRYAPRAARAPDSSARRAASG
jgi:PucR C-terminal helix-turn-helix domain